MSRAPSGRLTAVALGYQGFGNVGDEAILSGIECLLDGTTVQIGAVICGPLVDGIAAMPNARRIVSRRLLPTPSGLYALWRADALVLSGGGLLHDHWWSVVPRYLAWIVLARASGARVVWLGVGIGPLRRRIQGWLARLALRLTHVALVRDPRSAELLGGPSDRVHTIPDPSLFNDVPEEEAEPRSLGVVARGPTPSDRAAFGRRASALAAICVLAHRRGWRPMLLTMAGRTDEAFADEVQRRAARKGLQLPKESLGPPPAAALRRLATFEAVVSVRLHGVLLASLAGTPCVPVAYDPKVEHAADALGIRDLVITPDEGDPERTLDLLDRAMSHETRATVATRVREARARREEVGALVEAAIGGTR